MSISHRFIGAALARRHQHLTYLGRTGREAEANTAAAAQDFALRRVLDECQINCVVDVGANVGQFARRVRACGYAGRIASVEPAVDTFRDLQRNMTSDGNWAGFNYAVGATRGTARLNVMPESVMNSLCEPDPVAVGRIGNNGVVQQVQDTDVFPLDEVWDELTAGVTEPRVFLKTDTQGYDYAVLAGAARRALPAAAALQIEAAVERLYAGAQDWTQTLAQLLRTGWGIVGLYPAAHDAAEGTVVEFDCLLKRVAATPVA